jgi:uncharacterized protein (UPF0332 family)
MYHAARAVLATVNTFPRTHEGVVSEFGKRFVLTGVFSKDIGRNLAEAKAARETYEYGAASTATRSEAKATLMNAHNFLKVIKKYLERISARK